MDKFDWTYWLTTTFIITIVILTVVTLLAICTSGCSMLPHKQPILDLAKETPAGQMWRTVTKSNWLVTLAIPIVAFGAVAAFNGAAKLGFSSIIFGCVTLFMALATARFAMWMAVFGLIGSTAAVAASIYSRKKALVEIIEGVQDYRDNRVDHNDLDRRLATKQKSPTTKKIVQKIKTELKNKGEL